jgi:hypothetical protein
MTIIVVFYYSKNNQLNSGFTSYKEIVTKSYPIAVNSLALFY